MSADIPRREAIAALGGRDVWVIPGDATDRAQLSVAEEADDGQYPSRITARTSSERDSDRRFGVPVHHGNRSKVCGVSNARRSRSVLRSQLSNGCWISAARAGFRQRGWMLCLRPPLSEPELSTLTVQKSAQEFRGLSKGMVFRWWRAIRRKMSSSSAMASAM